MKTAEKDGWTGGSDLKNARKFLRWYESDDGPLTDYEFQGEKVDVKALVIEQPAANQVVVTEVDDDAPEDTNEMGEEMEDEEPKAVQRSAPNLANELKKCKADLEAFRLQFREFQKNAGKPTVSVKTGEELRYEDRAKKGRTAFRNLDAAKGFGHVLRVVGFKATGDLEASQAERKRLMEHLDKTGLNTKAYATTPLVSGGALVPEQYMADVINNVEQFGIARQLARVVTMTSDKLTRPRKTGLLQVFYPDEGGSISEDQLDWDNVTLAAKMGAVLTRASRQILQDSAIDLIDDTAQEIARAIAYVEDNTLFYGDGTTGTDNEYIPGVSGIINKFGGTATTDSRSHTGGDTADAHDAADLASWVGLLPGYARQSPVIVTSAELHSIIFDRLAINDVGGLTQSEYEAGMVGRYRGIPILTSQVFPSTVDASGDRVDALCGDFSRCAMLGDRMTLEIATSEERYFDTAQIAIRGLVRHDINVHDLGSTTTKSPVVALYQT